MSSNVAIVTGAAGNIGRGVCHALTKSGAAVVALDIDISRAEGVPDSEWGRRSAAGSPMGRVGDPEEDIGSVVVFLAGPGRFINGRTLHVDGGKGGYR